MNLPSLPSPIPHRGVRPTPVTNQRGGSQATALVRGSDAALLPPAGECTPALEGWRTEQCHRQRTNGDGDVDRNIREGTTETGITSPELPTAMRQRSTSLAAVTREHVGEAIVPMNSPARLPDKGAGVLPRDERHGFSMGQECRLECIPTRGGSMPTGERRVVWATDQVQDPRDQTAELIRFWERARADGLISAAEMMDVHVRLHRILRECDEALVAVEWVDAGERRAAGQLLGAVPAHVDRLERSILRRADELGMTLGTGNIIQFPHNQDSEPLESA